VEAVMNEQGQQTKKEDAWYSWLGYGAVMLAVAGYLWYFFTDFESSGGSRSINWLVALMYNNLGKVPTVGLVASLGLICFGVGAREYVKRSRESVT
jgi:hypothetical protein